MSTCSFYAPNELIPEKQRIFLDHSGLCFETQKAGRHGGTTAVGTMPCVLRIAQGLNMTDETIHSDIVLVGRTVSPWTFGMGGPTASKLLYATLWLCSQWIRALAYSNPM
jgi:hypothetical protein